MTSATLLRTIKVSVFLAVFFALFGAGTQEASAQPQLNFKRIVNNWPTIELYFSIACNGTPAYFTDKRYFKVYENGVEIGEFELWCPDPTVRCAISVSLVFDASGSMQGSGNAGAIAAGNAFVDMMDGINDEAAVVWFTSMVTVAQGMTSYLDLLHNAISGLPANGATAVWDGIYFGLLELINNGVNPCRAVIAMTDGGDNSSSRSPAEIISLANRNRIRIFTIGLGSGIQSEILKNIADLTGGRYYETPNPAQLTAIYQEISTIIFAGFQECIITYQAKCMDGGFRKVDLSVINFCNGQDTKTKTYKAPKDTSTYIPLKMQIGKREARGNTDVKVPIQLLDQISNELFYGATFSIQFDPACIQFKDIKTPPGSVLEGIPITITPAGDMITFTTTDKKLLDIQNVPATMAELTFKTSDPDGKDTVCCPIKFISWVFEAGCFRPVLKDGEICIIPRMPVVDCGIQAPPQLLWVRSLKDYNPNPFTVSMQLNNTGDREARNARFKIEYDKKDLTLVAPVNNVQNGTPRNVDPAGISEARWDVMAKRRLTGDSVSICIVAAFDNHDSVRCCLKVWVPPADAVLACTVTAPEIKADRVNQKYVPMPFDVTVTVVNEGGKKSDSVFARIVVPADLRLYGPDAPDRNTKRVLPAILNPGQQGGVSWTLWHPITLTTKEYLVGVWVRTANADSTYCEVKVVIPPLEAPVLAPMCRVPDSLHFDETLGSYVPNPFDVTLTCTNKGGLPASNVTGFVYLPGNVVLTNPGDPLRQAFPSPMNEWKTGDPVPSMKWNVTYTRKLRYDSFLDFKFVVGGVGPTGLPTDSVETWCRVRVPGLAPSFACDILMPDSLPINSTKTDVTPNPFTVRYRVWNTSKQTATINVVDLNYPIGDGLTLDGSTPKTRTVNQVLPPGDTLTYTWIFSVQNRITRRFVQMTGIAYDDEGNPIPCGDDMPIANLETALQCAVTTSEPVIKYIPVLQEYDPTRWVITVDLTNTGGAPITDVVAELELADSTLVPLQEFDAGFPDNTNPKGVAVLFPQSTKTFQWGFRLASPNISGISQFLYYNVKYKSKETPTVTSGCDVPVEIEPVVMPILSCQLMAPDTIYFDVDKYVPSPYDLYVEIANTGNGDAMNVKAYVLQDTRFNILPPASREYGDLGAGKTITFGDTTVNGPFKLKVNPRATDGYDTVRVVVMADGVPSAQCLYPIYVMHEQRPVFEMACKAIPDRLTFDDQLNDYVPNPFDVVTTAVNIGETKAENCQLVFVGPPRFTPADNTPIVNVGVGGRMNVLDTVTYTWKLVPLRRSVGGWDTLIYQIQGRGGMGNRIIIGECKVPIYVPPARAADYQMVCTAPATLTFDNSAGVYIPDPFEFKAVVTNAGQAEGQDLSVTAQLPPGVILASGETATKLIGNLAVSASAEVKWLVRPVSNTSGANVTVRLCAKVVDKLGKENDCCSDVIIPPATKATLSLTCDSQFDTLKVDRQRGTYETNPFMVYVKITNNGDRPADNVRVVVLPQSNELRVLGDPERYVAARLDQKVTTDTIGWKIYATPRTVSGWIDIQFVVTADGLASTQCTKPVYVPEVGRPSLTCNTQSSMSCSGDTLYFNYSIGDYRDCNGTRSSTGKYNVFTITSHILNGGAAQANRVRATLLPPEGVTLDAGETAIKDAGDLLVNGSTSVSWNIRPVRQSFDAQRTFSVVLTSDNALQQKCDQTVTVQGAPKIVTVRMPDNNVGQFKDKITIPVYVDTTIGKDIYVYKLNVKFDPELVRFVDAVSTNTLTARGWSGPRTRLLATPGSAQSNVVRVEDYTTGSPLNVRDEGMLVLLVFEAVYNGGEKSLRAEAKPIEFLDKMDVDVSGVPKTWYSSMNSPDDESAGTDVQLNYIPGVITVSGDCIVPLIGGTHYSLAQNKPNPFNPSTVIEYEIGEETQVRLVVFDQLGREVAVPVNARQKAGKYAVIFDASTLASGTYVYRIETAQFTKTLRMVLAR